MPNRLHLVLPVVAVLMVVCGAQQPTASPTTVPAIPAAPAAVPSPSAATAAPTKAPVVATATSIQLQTQTPTEAPLQTLPLFNGIPHGITPDGFHFLGMFDAPVTLTDYSDFL